MSPFFNFVHLLVFDGARHKLLAPGCGARGDPEQEGPAIKVKEFVNSQISKGLWLFN